MVKSLYSLLWLLGFLSFDNANILSCLTSIVVDDIGLGFIFPIYIIIKTKRYLPKLWNNSREIVGANNDFYSTNPATVAPAPGP